MNGVTKSQTQLTFTSTLIVRCMPDTRARKRGETRKRLDKGALLLVASC